MKHLLISVTLAFICLNISGQSVSFVEFLQDSQIATDDQQEQLLEWVPEEFHAPAELLYRYSEHGPSAFTFHQLCDGRSNTIVIIKTINDFTVGGYNSGEWTSNDQFIQGLNDNFLFSLELDLKLDARPGSVHIWNHSTTGPAFNNLIVHNLGQKIENHCAIFGTGYECPCNPACWVHLAGGTNGFPDPDLDFIDYEVWQLNSDGCQLAFGEQVQIDVDGDGETDYYDDCYSQYTPMFEGSDIVCVDQDLQLVELMPEDYRIEANKIYSSIDNGSSSDAFHSAVNGFSKTMLLIKTDDGEIIGGYNEGAYMATSGSQQGLDQNFMFNLNDMRRHHVIPGAIHITNGFVGPHFGQGDLKLGFDLINDQASSELGAGYSYDSSSNQNDGEYGHIDNDGVINPVIVELWQLDGDEVVIPVFDANNNGICDNLEIYNLPGICQGCMGDFDGNGSINTADLTGFLIAFGTDCPNQ